MPSAFFFVHPTSRSVTRVNTETGQATLAQDGATRSLSTLHDALAAAITGKREAGGVTTAEVVRAFQDTAPIFRAVSVRGKTLSAIPYTLRRIDSPDIIVFDSEDPAMQPDPLLRGLQRLFRLSEMALCTVGKVRIHMEHPGSGMVDRLRWYDPTTIYFKNSADQKDYDADGIFQYRRRMGDKEIILPAADILAIDTPDPFVELGAGTAPIRPALDAARLLRAYTSFLADHLEGGLIKNFALVVEDPAGKGRKPSDAAQTEAKSRFFRWLQSRGKPRSADDIFILSELTKIVEYGEGIKDLADNDLAMEAWRQASAAFGVPLSMMTENAANYAEKMLQKLELYETELFPDASLIEDAFNDQLLSRMGLTMRFERDRVDAVQFAQVQQAQAIQLLTGGQAVISREEARDNLAGMALQETTDLGGDGQQAPVVDPAAGF